MSVRKTWREEKQKHMPHHMLITFPHVKEFDIKITVEKGK